MSEIERDVLQKLSDAIDELGRDTANLCNRGGISTDELARYLLDAVVMLKAVLRELSRAPEPRTTDEEARR